MKQSLREKMETLDRLILDMFEEIECFQESIDPELIEAVQQLLYMKIKVKNGNGGGNSAPTP